MNDAPAKLHFMWSAARSAAAVLECSTFVYQRACLFTEGRSKQRQQSVPHSTWKAVSPKTGCSSHEESYVFQVQL
jgi:hypothetical protein